MWIAGILIVVGQFWPSTSTGNDVPLRAATEEFIAQLAPTWDAGIDTALSPDDAQRVRNLGLPHWSDRERASVALRNRADLRLLLWAEMAPDAEIRLRAETILVQDWRCWRCRGSGLYEFCGSFQCPAWSSMDVCRHDGPRVTFRCMACYATGYRKPNS